MPGHCHPSVKTMLTETYQNWNHSLLIIIGLLPCCCVYCLHFCPLFWARALIRVLLFHSRSFPEIWCDIISPEWRPGDVGAVPSFQLSIDKYWNQTKKGTICKSFNYTFNHYGFYTYIGSSFYIRFERIELFASSKELKYCLQSSNFIN